MDGDDVDPVDCHRHRDLEELWRKQIQERPPSNVGFLSFPKHEDQTSGFETNRCLEF